MTKTNKILAIALLAGLGMSGCNSAESDNKTAAMDDTLSTSQNNTDMAGKTSMPDVSAWPERPRLAVKEMTAKYGAPLEV